MKQRVWLVSWLWLVIITSLASAQMKEGMPQLSQVDNTCFPTSAAQLLIWFSKNGYPKLLPGGASRDAQYESLVHRLMIDCKTYFSQGASLRNDTNGVADYIHSVGYGCTVSSRGIYNDESFSADWLNENKEPNQGFILILEFVKRGAGDSFQDTKACHAVTLIGYDPESLVIQDTARSEEEPGRKILVPSLLSHGLLLRDQEPGVSVEGLLLLDGDTLLEAPPESQALLIGAVGVIMYPSVDQEPQGSAGSGMSP